MEQTESSTGIAKNAARFFSGTLISRLTGLLRDVAMAAAFGDHPSVGAFMVAFRLSNLFRRLLGEGALQTTLVPHFEGLRAGSEQRAYSFFRDLTFSLATGIILLLIVAEGALALFGKGQVISLTALMSPGLLFISLYGIYLTFLQCHEKFFTASVAPAFCNTLWIIGTLALSSWEAKRAMPILALLVTAGFLIQWLTTLPQTHALLKQYPKERLHLFSPDVREMGRVASIGLLGAGAMQISGCVDALFARFADPRGPIYLWYALRVEQLPLALIGIACTSALVPRVVRAIKTDRPDEALSLTQYGVHKLLMLLVPMTLLLLLLSPPLVTLLYGRGAFGEVAITETSLCLSAYGLALIPSAFIFLCTSIAYAQNKHSLPTRAALQAITINALLNAIFVFIFHLGALSIALATAVSTWYNFAYLAKRIALPKVAPAMKRKLTASLLLGLAAFFLVPEAPSPLLNCFVQVPALLLASLLPHLQKGLLNLNRTTSIL